MTTLSNLPLCINKDLGQYLKRKLVFFVSGISQSLITGFTLIIPFLKVNNINYRMLHRYLCHLAYPNIQAKEITRYKDHTLMFQYRDILNYLFFSPLTNVHL